MAPCRRRGYVNVRSALSRVRYGTSNGQHWVRVVLDREVEAHLARLGPAGLDAVEISGSGRAHLPWRSHRTVEYPDFDLLSPSDIGQYDVVICEQVLEHVRDPWLAVSTLESLCRPGGHVVMSTPFMLRLHFAPSDYWRFAPDGLRELATAAGLEIAEQGAWGNSWCVRANRRRWIVFRPFHRVMSRWSLANEPLNPQVIWLFARRPV